MGCTEGQYALKGCMGSIAVQNVTKQFAGQVVLDGVSLELHSGRTVGLVGPNGAGKTTLFKLIAGKLTPDLGTVTRSRDLTVGYLSQEPDVGVDSTVHDEVLSVFADVLALERRLHELSHEIAEKHEGPEYEQLADQYARVEAQFTAAGGYTLEQQLGEILGGLGFSPADYKLPMAALSGGQKCRVALAKLLLQDAAYLLLDEPTNHLDIDAVRWLEKFLAGHHGGATIISHDRYLLDRVAEHIIEVERGKLASYPGNYTNYAETRARRRLTQDRQFEKDREFIEKEREFIAKHLAGQRSQEAKGRRTRLERRIAAGEFVLERPDERQPVKLGFEAELQPGRTIFDVQELSKAYGDKVLFRNLSLTIGAGQRLGITGPNGTGKSTLLRVLLGKLPPDAGTVQADRKAAIGYYEQEARDLDPGNTVLSEIQTLRPDLKETAARSILGRFLFRGDDVFKPVGRLSGGEQSRVRLVKLMLTAPNVLVLDEPTNHLDIPSREALEEALTEFPGTIVAVSHDRYFLDRIVNRLLVLRAGRHELFLGNYTRYIEELERRATQPTPAKTDTPAKPATQRKPRAPSPARNPPRSRFDRLKLEELELFIMEGEERFARLNERFADPAILRDKEAVVTLKEEIDGLRAELDEAEAAWNRRAEA